MARKTTKPSADIPLTQVKEPSDLGHDLGPPPANPEALDTLLRTRLGISIASQLVVRPGAVPNAELATPFDYLVHTFFEGRFARSRSDPVWRVRYHPADDPPDSIVWACRGGGKTYIGAVATMLDLVFKPRIQVRILGGSLAQSARMMAYLGQLFEHPLLAPLVISRKASTSGKVELENGSRAEILAQSETSVRGVRVHKLRCDEVEMFSRPIWEAAQLTTKSMPLKGPWGDHVRGSVDALSTMHLPTGLMQELINTTRARESDERVELTERQAAGAAAPPRRSGEQHSGRRIFRWDVLQSMQRCSIEHVCDRCPLASSCGGAVRKRPSRLSGHAPLSDILALQSRVGLETWNSEMLCLRPSKAHCVFPEFDRETHVFADGLQRGMGRQHQLLCGMDFGIRGDTAVLWADVEFAPAPDPSKPNAPRPLVRLRILDELHEANRPVGDHGQKIIDAPWGKPECVVADPAGRQRSAESGRSCVQTLQAIGLRMTTKINNRIVDGLKIISAALRPASGDPPRLIVHERCKTLIAALESYHYDPEKPEDLRPVKDGPDHAIDALRYLIVHSSGSAPRGGEWVD